jgi:hypothetical protein
MMRTFVSAFILTLALSSVQSQAAALKCRNVLLAPPSAETVQSTMLDLAHLTLESEKNLISSPKNLMLHQTLINKRNEAIEKLHITAPELKTILRPLIKKIQKEETQKTARQDIARGTEKKSLHKIHNYVLSNESGYYPAPIRYRDRETTQRLFGITTEKKQERILWGRQVGEDDFSMNIYLVDIFSRRKPKLFLEDVSYLTVDTPGNRIIAVKFNTISWPRTAEIEIYNQTTLRKVKTIPLQWPNSLIEWISKHPQKMTISSDGHHFILQSLSGVVAGDMNRPDYSNDLFNRINTIFMDDVNVAMLSDSYRDLQVTRIDNSSDPTIIARLDEKKGWPDLVRVDSVRFAVIESDTTTVFNTATGSAEKIYPTNAKDFFVPHPEGPSHYVTHDSSRLVIKDMGVTNQIVADITTTDGFKITNVLVSPDGKRIYLETETGTGNTAEREMFMYEDSPNE